MERINNNRNRETLDEEADAIIYCYHCGDECPDKSIQINEKIFCCNGCKTVYEILYQHDLCNYYTIENSPGITKKYDVKRNLDYLEDTVVKEKFINYSDGKISKATFTITQMHCSSCIWILENLYKLNPGIISSQVNFLQKKLFINFAEEKTSLKKIVELLDSIGYGPLLNLEDKQEEKSKTSNKSLYYKIGIAGFCFGNIMLLSFPEYLSVGTEELPEMKRIFAYLNILLSLPVFFYSSLDYFFSAWKGLKKKIVNIDVPIALGIIVLFLRSIIDIIFFNGPGFLDSLSGLLFFLLIGRLFQNKTYETLNFERNYKSYFPISVTVRKDKTETTIPVEKMGVGTLIIIRNNELIPADSILIKGKANIDYSFVTGESTLVSKDAGEMIYAGGRQVGGVIELQTIKEVSQSYLTQLWNSNALSKEEESRIVSLANSISKHFTFIILLIALLAAFYWLPYDSTLAFNAFTAVLIVACPCALALSTPFTLGNTLRIFGRNKFYLKNTHVIEQLASINHIVFDKTGTITENDAALISFDCNLTDENKSLIKSAVRNSSHPLSRAIYDYLQNVNVKTVDSFNEITGEGITAIVNGKQIKVGSEFFITGLKNTYGNNTQVFVSIDGNMIGSFSISNKYREGLKEIIYSLEKQFDISLLSGDNDSEKKNLTSFFIDEKELHFNKSPHDKLEYVSNLQISGKKVLMIGDGLNDAGALKKSDVGISISDNINNFSPACDGILDSKSFKRLADFILFSIKSRRVIIASFVLSFIYNIVGLSFAITGSLSPIVAAILMPVSSISVVVFTTFSINFIARKERFI
ncbi:MAG: heavy metal translocating P-type ATPase metal-binding domain-containing protein [Bacteroidota bacterium]